MLYIQYFKFDHSNLIQNKRVHMLYPMFNIMTNIMLVKHNIKKNKTNFLLIHYYYYYYVLYNRSVPIMHYNLYNDYK